MKKIRCYIKNFEPYGYFVGALLSKQNGNLYKVRDSVEFYNLLHDELEMFLRSYSYSKQNVETFFSRYFVIYQAGYKLFN